MGTDGYLESPNKTMGGSQVFEESYDSQRNLSPRHNQPALQKMYPAVKKEDISKEAESIYYRLYSKNFSLKDALNKLQTNNVKATKAIRIKDLIDVFINQPFLVNDYEDAKLLARYMIEDNIHNKIPYNENSEENIF